MTMEIALSALSTTRYFAKLDSLVNCVKGKIPTSPLHTELTQMMRASKGAFRSLVFKYKAHQMRAVAQFQKLKKETASFSKTQCGLWFDHKQKILPMRYREGQIKYFAKRVMSLLGAMLVCRTTRKGNQKTALLKKLLVSNTSTMMS
jgi:hypothetical protein